MANNPIFPFYVNDFEGGTRHMTDAEAGCYLRLLMAQFNRGGQLPNDENILRRYCTSFDESWPIVKEKFERINGSKLQNKRLEIERVKRENFVDSRSKNKKGKTKSHENHVKNTSETSENHLGKGKGKGKGYENENGNGKQGGGAGEEKFVVPRMCKLWYENFPMYSPDDEHDFSGMGKILWFIAKQHHLKKVEDAETQTKILSTLQVVADKVNEESFWVNKPIKSIANNIQEFYNKIKNPQDGKSGKQANGSQQGNLRAEVQAERDRRREERRQAAG